MGAETTAAAEDLLRLVRAGDGSAAGRLLERYRGYLDLLVRVQIGRRLQGKVDSSDLVQETFLEAHGDFAGFRGTTEAELVAWLRQILARNLANQVRRYHRTQRRNVNLERDLMHELEQSSRVIDQGLVAKHSSPSQQAVRREQAVLLADALTHLPEAYRQVLVLRHLEGLTFPEVAIRMKRTVGAVKNLWARALIKINTTLGDVS